MPADVTMPRVTLVLGGARSGKSRLQPTHNVNASNKNPTVAPAALLFLEPLMFFWQLLIFVCSLLGLRSEGPGRSQIALSVLG